MKNKILEEKIAMNIVYQIGDLLSFEIKDSIVDARQATNDKAIDFVMKVLTEIISTTRRETRLEIRDEILGVYSFTYKQGWKGEEAFKLVEKELLKLADKLKEKQDFEGLTKLPKTICDKKGHIYTKVYHDIFGYYRGCKRCTCIIFGKPHEKHNS